MILHITMTKLQHPNVYNTKLPRQEVLETDRVRNLEEIRTNLSAAVLKNDTGQCVIWTINLHKYIILHGLAFTRLVRLPSVAGSP